jgi:hypothetical protein
MLSDGTLSACYRITLNGLRDYRRFHGIEIVDERPETIEKPQPRFPWKKKQKSDSPEAVVVSASEEALVPAA